MSGFSINITNPIPLILLIPKSINNVRGVVKKEYPSIEEALNVKDKKGNSINLFFGSFKTYGGTERNVNGVYSIEDTANIETMYRPDITSACRIARANDGAIFDIINEPEDINQRHQFLKFKIKRLYEKIREILKDREKTIIELRFGLNGDKPKTQKQIAKMMGISRSYVSRIETKAIGKLAKELKE